MITSKHITQLIKMSPEQIKKYEKIITQYCHRIITLRQSKDLDKASVCDMLTVYKNKKNESIRELLTNRQYTIYRKMEDQFIIKTNNKAAEAH